MFCIVKVAAADLLESFAFSPLHMMYVLPEDAWYRERAVGDRIFALTVSVRTGTDQKRIFVLA